MLKVLLFGFALEFKVSGLFALRDSDTNSDFDSNCKPNGYIVIFKFFFEIIFWRTQVLFVGPLIPLFGTSGDISSGFLSQSGQPYLHLV